jgi:hypothetical protein
VTLRDERGRLESTVDIRHRAVPEILVGAEGTPLERDGPVLGPPPELRRTARAGRAQKTARSGDREQAPAFELSAGQPTFEVPSMRASKPSRPLLRRALGAGLLLGAGLAFARGGEPGTDLRAALEEHRLELRIEDGRLAGPGADWLREQARQSQFLFLGEEHGVAEVPAFAGMLFRELHPLGYRYVALEISPLQAERLDRYARLGDSRARAEYLACALPNLPDSSEELLSFARLAGEVARAKAPFLWGLEQEQRARPLFERLAALAPNPEAKKAAQAALAKVDGQEASGVYIPRGYAAEIDSIRRAFQPKPESEAGQVLSALELSHRLYEGQRTGQTGFASNLEREEMFKSNFLRNYRAAQRGGEPAPRVLFDLGAWHGMRGFSPVDISSLGNFLAEFARGQDSRLFNLLVTCGRNGKRAAVGEEAGKVVACGADEAPFFRPVLEAAVAPWSLFELAPIRPMVHAKLFEPAPEIRPMLFAYDAALVIADTTPTHAAKASDGR